MLTLVASLLLAVPAEGSAAAAPAKPAAVDLDALVANPPFGAGAAPKPGGVVATTSEYELRGMYQDGGKTYFSLYNAATKQSRWVAKDEAATDPALPSFKAFDPETQTLTVEVNGRPAQVAMKAATVSKYEPPKEPAPAQAAEAPRGGPPLPEPGPDGKVQTPWGNFTPEQIAAYRAERERRWQERMQQVQAEGADPRRARDAEAPAERPSRGERSDRGDRGGRPPR